MAFLAEAGELLGESLDFEQVMTRLATLATREFADSFVVDIVEDGALKRIAKMHADPAKQAFLDELSKLYPPAIDSLQPTSQVIRTGEPLLMPENWDVASVASNVDNEFARLVRAIGTRTALSVPLVARGRRIGAMTFGSDRPGRRYERADLDLAKELARRVALAIENARLHRQTVQALHLRDEFLSVASHELRTPMTGLTLALQVLREADRSVHLESAAMHRFVELALAQGQRLNRLIDELLEVSRIQMNKLWLDRAEVDLVAIVTDVVQHFELNLAQAGCQVSIHSAGPVVGSWDRSRLDQVVTNLLSNAIKFGANRTPGLRGSSSRISASASIPPRPRASSSPSSAPCPPGITAGSAWDSTSPARSSRRTAARSASRASRAPAPPSQSSSQAEPLRGAEPLARLTPGSGVPAWFLLGSCFYGESSGDLA
jgi:signal transduction histidine kinase